MTVGLRQCIAHARRRWLRNQLMTAGARAAAAGIGLLDLVLLFGTDTMHWRLLAILPFLAFAAAVTRALRRRPTAYRTAQLVDEWLHLTDSLSTAIYYSALASPRRCNEGLRLSQLEQATVAA